MLNQRNIFETISIVTICSWLVLVLFHYLTGIFGVWLPVYIITIFVLSVYFSSRALQKLLALNAPINFTEIIEDSRWSFIGRWIPVQRLFPKNPVQDEWKEYDTNELSIISTVLERRLVSSWYAEYVSPEISFPFACKELLDHAIGKAFQISNHIDTPTLYTDVCSVLLSHLKEYKRAVKLLELSNEGNFRTYYRMMHPAFSKEEPDVRKKCPSAEHCKNILRIVLKEVIPFDLWDTPPAELLIRILTKRLDSFIKETISDPNWLNEKLLQMLQDKNFKVDIAEDDTEPETLKKTEENAKEKAPPEIKLDAPESNKSESITPVTIEAALSDIIMKSTAPILQNVITEETYNTNTASTDVNIEKVKSTIDQSDKYPLDFQASPILRQRRGRQGRSEVKIHDRIVEGSVKTWDTDVDLKCISVGQDLLASLDGGITVSRLWETDNAEGGEGWSPNPPQKASSQPQQSPPALWFGEEDATELELDSSPPKPNVRPEPPANFSLTGIHNMRDLQSTVNQAKHKIGDLQDEAAGMMEGILDFGIAGLKKGLRMTGLHEGHQDKLATTPSKERPNMSRRTPPEPLTPKHETGHFRKDISPALEDEVNNVSNTNSSLHLVKQHRVTSQDSVPRPIPGKSEEGAKQEGGSPELEYEEAADFASSIAKLRSLLQQRTADTPPKWQAEGVWWEGAEETRGRTQHSRHAGRPVDTATLADEYDVSADRSPVPEQTINNMQRLDKLFQRTVTGVLNSIKTAVGGEGDDVPNADLEIAPEDWQYVCTAHDLSIGGSVARLVATRRALAVDAALDSLDLTMRPAAPAPSPASPPLDLEEWCCGEGARWAGVAELAAAAGLWRSHVTHTLATVLLADVTERAIRAWLRELAAWLRRRLFRAFEEMAHGGEGGAGDAGEAGDAGDARATCDDILERLPGLTHVFGAESLRSALGLVGSSFADGAVNADVAYRLLDVLALHFTRAAVPSRHA